MADPNRQVPAPENAPQRSFLTFRLDEEVYALPVEMVNEIITVPQVTRVPMSPTSLLGIANLRGAALPVASLRGLLERDRGTSKPARVAIVLEGAAPVALAVDSVDVLVNVAAGGIETRQAELAAAAGEHLTGAFRYQAGHGERAAKILDIAGLIRGAFTPRASNDGQAPGGIDLKALWGGAEEAAPRGGLVTFEVAGQEFALALEDAREIIPTSGRLTAMPHAEALALGMIAYRETLLPVFSLRGLLGLPKGERAESEKIIVTNVQGTLAGLLVDRMRSVLPMDADLMEEIPAVLAARAGGEAKIRSIYRAEEGRRLISVLAPEHLFREDVMQRLTRETAASVPTREGPTAETKTAHFLVFRLCDNEFALPVEAVDEVATMPDRLTRIPKVPAFLEGVVNLRGEVLPVIDQRRRFDMPPRDTGQLRRLVVMRTARHRAGIIVDGITQVLRTAQDAIDPAPDLAGEKTRLVYGVINLPAEHRMVLLLDPDELLTRTEQKLLETFAADTRPVDL
ncbi:chemotaxis protein CheW [Xanthobacter sp. DSM 24535]|uniref:chemotaxis protein CheW n=1 Tax=Roseixanthobacter psychrophilus TaxID=3119917 RepID=UPI003729A795